MTAKNCGLGMDDRQHISRSTCRFNTDGEPRILLQGLNTLFLAGFVLNFDVLSKL